LIHVQLQREAKISSVLQPGLTFKLTKTSIGGADGSQKKSERPKPHMNDSSRNVFDDIDDDVILSKMISEQNTTKITFEGILIKALIHVDIGSQISTITEDCITLCRTNQI